jgi:hypothetical protein
MKFGEFRRLMNTVPITADNDEVSLLDTDTADVFRITGVHYVGPDADGNHGTVWLRGVIE